MAEEIRSEFRLSQKDANLRFWIMLVVGIFLAAMGVFILVIGSSTSIAAVIGGLLPLLGGSLLAYLGFWWKNKVAKDKDPHLIITEAFIHATRKTERPVPWSEVKRVVLAKSNYRARQNQQRSGYLGIDVNDLNAFGPTGSKGFLAKASSLMGGGDITLQTDGLDGTEGEIRAAVLRYCPADLFHEKDA